MNLCSGNNNDKAAEDSNICKQRFKGIETFLRRIAFNLGNTPSQTEVKIISCIPIDVTDLQNKIISLERQLFEATNFKSQPKQPKNTSVHTALAESTKRRTNAVLNCQCSAVRPQGLETKDNTTMHCNGASLERGKSLISVFPKVSRSGLYESQPLNSTENCEDRDSQDSHENSYRKTFFRRHKKKKCIKKKEKPKTQWVYYAQTESNPFHNYCISTDMPFIDYSKPILDNTFSKTYLSNVLHRHFSPECVVEEFSDTSHFTSPVCRDFQGNRRCPYESDVCSCCHGQFQNVDKYMSKNQNFIVEPVAIHQHSQFNKDVYNDSTLYDIVPVKEKTTKSQDRTKLYEDKIPIKEQKRSMDIRCWAESARSKPRYQTTAVYHQTKTHTKYNNNKKQTPRLQKLEANIRKKTPTRYKENRIDKRTGHTDTSNSCYVDYSEIYPKTLITQQDKKLGSISKRAICKRNAECLTIDVDTTNLTITRSIQIDINSTETRTEETLNQIKSILQSVLAEVKTNPQVNNLPEEKSKRDAVIQKGPSQSNMQTCSTLLHSFTYNNSFNADPCLPSCSRQPPAPFYYTNVPFQRPNNTQHFPLLIQTPGHQKCGCFFKNSIHKNAPTQKQAANIATNTEIDDQGTQDTETDKLIKEIYKSIALTLETPKETSNSEYDELKSQTNNSTNASDLKELHRTMVVMSETPKRDKQTTHSITPSSTMTVISNYNDNVNARKTDEKWKNAEHYLDYDRSSSETEILEAPEPETSRGIPNVASTISEHYSEELSSVGESDGEIQILEEVKDNIEKKGLLKRMLGSVKIFNRKKQKKGKGSPNQEMVHELAVEESESDSDDYQTIYSEKINPHKEQFKISVPSKRYVAHRAQQKAEQHKIRSRRSPNMEQEYRRQWNEQLMFQEDRARRYSSMRPYSLQQTPVYWQNYEARSAIVDHNRPHQATYHPTSPAPMRSVIHKLEQTTSPLNIAERKDEKSKFSWLKKHKLGMSQCGEQWKKFILEN